MDDWMPDLNNDGGPRYLAIANCIAEDVRRGLLRGADRLPAQRSLAKKLKLDFTTVARGYAEAQRRGLIESHVGLGTFVTALKQGPLSIGLSGTPAADPSLNLAPEPDSPALLARMREGYEIVGRNLHRLSQYQAFGGTDADKAAAASWLSKINVAAAAELTFLLPGTQPALTAVLATLTSPGDTILSEAMTYPGIRSTAKRSGLKLFGLPMDQAGVSAEAFYEACERLSPKAFYTNPTLQNPTTRTTTLARRLELIEIARRANVAIIEDDAYGLLPSERPPAFATLAPDVSWYLASLSKTLGAGLRLAYVVVPDIKAAWSFAAVARAEVLHASPITAALATQWIGDGTAAAILDNVRSETRRRHEIAVDTLRSTRFNSDPSAFHIWMPLPPPWTRAAFISHVRSTGIALTGSDAFTVGGRPPEAVRICLGGAIDAAHLRTGLDYIAYSLSDADADLHASF